MTTLVSNNVPSSTLIDLKSAITATAAESSSSNPPHFNPQHNINHSHDQDDEKQPAPLFSSTRSFSHSSPDNTLNNSFSSAPQQTASLQFYSTPLTFSTAVNSMHTAVERDKSNLIDNTNVNLKHQSDDTLKSSAVVSLSVNPSLTQPSTPSSTTQPLNPSLPTIAYPSKPFNVTATNPVTATASIPISPLTAHSPSSASSHTPQPPVQVSKHDVFQQQFKSFEAFLKVNYFGLVDEKMRFIRVFACITLIGFVLMLYTLYEWIQSRFVVVNRLSASLFALCLLWCLLTIASRLFHERLCGVDIWLNGVNNTLSIYYYRFDPLQLKIVSLPPKKRVNATKRNSLRSKVHSTLTSQHVFDEFENEMKLTELRQRKQQRTTNSQQNSNTMLNSEVLLSESSIKHPAIENAVVAHTTGPQQSTPDESAKQQSIDEG